MADLNKKTLRHFYCRDVLWQSFERMSEDLDRGVDDLVNEAMRLFAREKGYLPSEQESRPGMNRGPLPRAPVTPSVHAPTPSAGVAPATLPSIPAPPPLPPPRPSVPLRATGGQALAPAAAPALAEPAPTADAPPPLYLVFQDQRYLIDKEQFIIGRGSKTSDLPIRDGNISRKHAAVIRRNGGYFIKDLGSTNGIDHNGSRVDNKRIEEGDVYFICDYELKFTYR